MDYAIEKSPFPISMVRTDRGHEFQARFHWHVEDQGIQHVYIKPRTPQLNGKVERSHRTDETEFYQLLTYMDDVDLNTKLAAWENFYNFDRPHLLDQAPILNGCRQQYPRVEGGLEGLVLPLHHQYSMLRQAIWVYPDAKSNLAPTVTRQLCLYLSSSRIFIPILTPTLTIENGIAGFTRRSSHIQVRAAVRTSER